MRRIHAFEFEDQPWFPRVLRDSMTTFFQQGLILRQRVYDPVVPLLKQVMEHQGTRQLIDLCSGASGPWLQLLPLLDDGQAPVSLTLTDKYPNLDAFQSVAHASNHKIGYRTTPVDAIAVPDDLIGIRTIFTGFHHFRPPVARQILQDAATQQAAICIFEFTERRWKAILLTPLVAFFGLWFTTPFARPLSPTRLFWTYLIPILPLVVAWDGVVSHLRTYLPKELDALAHSIPTQGYTWEAGELCPPGGKFPIIYLLGYPTNPPQALPVPPPDC